MDNDTIEAYDQNAETISKRHQDLVPQELYKLVSAFFPKGSSVCDVGCGSGRDTAWLKSQGHFATGVDASKGMIEIARSKYPDIVFSEDSLPDLTSLLDNQYDAVLCSAVLMHIPQNQLPQASKNLIRILKKQGRMILSFRAGENQTAREEGKLYEKIDSKFLKKLLVSFGGKVIHEAENKEENRDHLWHTLVVEKKKVTLNRTQKILLFSTLSALILLFFIFFWLNEGASRPQHFSSASVSGIVNREVAPVATISSPKLKSSEDFVQERLEKCFKINSSESVKNRLFELEKAWKQFVETRIQTLKSFVDNEKIDVVKRRMEREFDSYFAALLNKEIRVYSKAERNRILKELARAYAKMLKETPARLNKLPLKKMYSLNQEMWESYRESFARFADELHEDKKWGVSIQAGLSLKRRAQFDLPFL